MPLSPELAKLVKDRTIEAYKAAGDWGPGLYRGGVLLEGADHKAVYGGRGRKKKAGARAGGARAGRSKSRARGGVLLEGAQHEAVYGGARAGAQRMRAQVIGRARGRGNASESDWECAEGCECPACRAEYAADRIEDAVEGFAAAVLPSEPLVREYVREGGRRMRKRGGGGSILHPGS